VTDSDDAASRGRAIFQRLRADKPEISLETATPAASGAPEVSQDPTTGAAPRAEPTRGPLPGLADLGGVETLLDGPEVPDSPAGASPSPESRPETETELDPVPSPHTGEGSVTLTADQPPEPILDLEDDLVEAEPPSAFARALPRVMAVANQKGGVGKTTTAVNLGACLADLGYRVLVVDLDPQGNASTGLGINIRDLQGSMYDVILHDLPIEDCVEATSVRNLFCAPSSLDLAGAEIELVPAFSRELRLKRALEDVRDDYDFVLIDCPPSLGLLTVNGLAAATEVVVPIQCEYYALEGLGQLLRNVNLVQRNLNPALEVSAIVLVMYDARTKLADQVVSEVREHFGAKVCRNVVPRTVRLSEAPSFGQPIIAFDASSRGAIAYRELAKEVSGGTPQRTR
jgi:chromosome partitioning protein